MASPLLINIALHGMETALMQAYRWKEGKPQFVRYADDLVVFHPTEEGVKKAQEVLTIWLADMGLELKPTDGISDKDQMIEEPCEVKISCTVLKTSQAGDCLA